jgi:hypothetical protein
VISYSNRHPLDVGICTAHTVLRRCISLYVACSHRKPARRGDAAQDRPCFAASLVDRTWIRSFAEGKTNRDFDKLLDVAIVSVFRLADAGEVRGNPGEPPPKAVGYGNFGPIRPR